MSYDDADPPAETGWVFRQVSGSKWWSHFDADDEFLDDPFENSLYFNTSLFEDEEYGYYYDYTWYLRIGAWVKKDNADE